MNQREILRLLSAGYTLRLDDRGRIEARLPVAELPDEGIPTNPEESNPLSVQDRHRYR